MANYSLDNFVDPIMVLNRAGTSDDPYIQKIENLKVNFFIQKISPLVPLFLWHEVRKKVCDGRHKL